MSLIQTSSAAMTSAGLDSTRLSPIFNKKFLTTAIAKLVLADTAEQFDLPKQAGALTMRFFRRGAVTSAANVQTLTEGTPISAFSNSTVETVEVTLAQFGDASKITDTRQMSDTIKQLDLETTRMGEEAAIHLDTQVRDALWTPLDASALVSAGGQKIDCTTRTAGARGITVADLDKAATVLTENRAPTFAGGNYLAIVSPRQAYDLRRDADWKNVATYSDKEKIYNGEIGKIFNVKVIIGTNPRTFTHNTSLTGEAAFVIGRECAGTIKLAGTNSPMAPQLVYNDKPDKSDPLNQFNIVGWKAWYASMCLNTKFGVLIKSDRNLLP